MSVTEQEREVVAALVRAGEAMKDAIFAAGRRVIVSDKESDRLMDLLSDTFIEWNHTRYVNKAALRSMLGTEKEESGDR